MSLTESQRLFLARAASLNRHGMGIIPRGSLQTRMATLLEKRGLLVNGGWGTHEETGVEAPMWKITPAGEASSRNGV